jgi:hypothetical protein
MVLGVISLKLGNSGKVFWIERVELVVATNALNALTELEETARPCV